MDKSRVKSQYMQDFLNKVCGLDHDRGNPRAKQLLRRLVGDLYQAIEDLDITDDEYWTAIGTLTELGQARQVALLSPGLGLDHFLDLRMEAREKAAGLEIGTPRTIEGPLYVEGAPMEMGEARLDDGKTPGEVFFMSGTVRDTHGNAIPGALVEVWHADGLGNYSYFDSTQSEFNLRRKIKTGADAAYSFRSIMPAGYAVPEGGPTEKVLDQLGRHGRRPAHIHFFISAEGHRWLTTQINIDGDPDLYDDFAFATRDGLIPKVVTHSDPNEIRERGLTAPFRTIAFDFVLQPESEKVMDSVVHRARAEGHHEGDEEALTDAASP